MVLMVGNTIERYFQLSVLYGLNYYDSAEKETARL